MYEIIGHGCVKGSDSLNYILNMVPEIGTENNNAYSITVSDLMVPAGHQYGLVSMKMLSINMYGDISQDAPAAEAVKVEQDVTCVARELNAAICSHGHSVEI